MDKVILNPLVSYIDDLIFYFHTLRSFISFIKIIKEFADISGLVMNEHKSFLINAKYPGFNTPATFKYLGIQYISETGQPDWDHLIDKVYKDIQLIKKKLSWRYYYEKVVFINTFIIPKITFYTRAFLPPPSFYDDFHSAINHLISKTSCQKRIIPVERGYNLSDINHNFPSTCMH